MLTYETRKDFTSLSHCRLLLPIVVLVTVLLGGADRTSAAVSPKDVGLRLSDVPHGFKQTVAHFTGNVEAAKQINIPLKVMNHYGRLGSYEADFERNVKTGIALIASDTVMYKSKGGASWGYSYNVMHAPHEAGAFRVPAPRVGEASTTFVIISQAAGRSLTSYIVAFRRGVYAVDVAINGKSGAVTIRQAIAYAQIVDRRIRTTL